MRYIWNILIAIDQFANTILGGDPDETISSRMGKLIAERKCRLCKMICRVLDWFEIHHCQKSVETDEGKNAVTPD